jgi:hypothetical protein
MTMRYAARFGLCLALALAACGGDDDGPAAPEPRTYTFGPFDLDPGEEMFGDCVSASLDNDEPVYVNAVELVTQSGFHHSNWFWVPETTFPGPDGVWNCDSRSYDEVVAGGAGGVLFAQSTQSVTERMAFPEGVVIPIPPRAKIVAGIHLLNASDSPLATSLDVTITPVAREDVTVKLAALAYQYRPLALPPRRKAEVSVECDMAEVHERVIGTPLDFNLFYALPHYHSLGTGYELVAVGGPNGDVVIASSGGGIGEPLGKNIEPSFSLAGFQKVRFTCKFDNDTDRVVRWGLGDGEMCVFQGFTDSIYKWGGQTAPNGTTQMVDDGEVVRFTHPCDMYGFPIVDP